MSKTEEMKLPITVLAEADYNARAITATALSGLAVSAETFGDLSGIVFNERTGRLVAGHQRMKVIRASGTIEWVRTGKAEGYITHGKTGERFHVRIVDWDETTERMANLVANNPAIQGQFTGAAINQLREMEEHVKFEALQLDSLESALEKEAERHKRKLANERKKLKEQEDEEGGQDESDRLGTTFAIIVECTNEAHQRELLNRFMKEGVQCRALT